MLNKTLLPETLTKVNRLLEYLHDSYKGYYESADMIEDLSLKEKFVSAAHSRSQMINDLEKVIISNNEEPAQRGTVAGAAHRVFVDLKSLVTGKDTTAVLKEVERGERTLINVYKETLANVDNPEVNLLLQNQLQSIEQDFTKWELAEHK
jgi:uncharacterized protein (TIGR02284 family)